MFKDKFYKKLTVLAVPILLQQLIGSSLNLVDNLMIGQLQEVSIASVGLANRVYFLVMLFVFGICSGSSIFFSQYWGKKDMHSIHKTLGLGLTLSLIISTIFTIVIATFPRFIMGIFSPDLRVIEAGNEYLSVAVYTYIPYAISAVFYTVFRSIGKTKIPLFVSAIALAINTLLNYMLILGNFGMPALGVKGAAIATLTARLVEVTIILCVAYFGKNNIGAGPKELFSFSFDFIKRLMKKIWLVIANEGAYGFGMVGYSIIYARIGTDAAASMNIVDTLFSMLFIFAAGIGNGLSILIGNSLGADKFERAKRYARKGIISAVACGVFVALVMLVFRDGILSLYNIKPSVMQDTKDITNILMAMMPIVCFEFTLFIGVLRAGGDTISCAVIDVGSLYGIGLPLAFLGAFVFHLPLPYVYLLSRAETIARAVASFVRYKSNVWVKNVT